MHYLNVHSLNISKVECTASLSHVCPLTIAKWTVTFFILVCKAHFITVSIPWQQVAGEKAFYCTLLRLSIYGGFAEQTS